MRFPCPVLVVTCLPCGFREAIRPGAAYPPRCSNCGSPLEHYVTKIENRGEWRQVFREGSRNRVVRPRLVVGAPA